MKKILITGENSYIGKSLENWLKEYPDKYSVETLDLKNELWKEHDFSCYDTVFHVAGIAHVSSNPKMEKLYYKVNRDLTIEAAEKSKKAGVKQFIFMSSIIVYGESTQAKRIINIDTVPVPSNFYGESKLQAEVGIKKLHSDDFKVVILRPPMIYGKNSKGNYPRLAKLAKKTPIFPDFENERSMLYIDNLCEFIKLTIDNDESGVFFPQNAEYVKTSELVKIVATVNGNKIIMFSWLNWLIRWMFPFAIIKKVFGNLTYEKSMSEISELNYQIRSFKESIELTEKN